MSYFSLINLFSIFSDGIMIYFQVSQIHISLLFGVISFEKHVAFIVLFLIICFYCFNINWILWSKFIWNFFRRFILIRFFRLFSKTTKIHSRLFRSFFSWCTFWRLLSISRRRLLSSFNRRLTFFRFNFRLLFFGLLIFRRHWIKNSWRFIFFFLIVSWSKIKNIQCFYFIL